MSDFDLNCDLGELDGPAGEQLDRCIIPLIRSANVACGAHAGSEQRMSLVAELCRQHNVRFGAHPSYPDRANFGRVELSIADADLYQCLAEQLRLALQIANAAGIRLTHVKPHGALYNVAAKRRNVAELIVQCVLEVTPDCELYGLSGSTLIAVAKEHSLKTRSEVFADRNYASDGTLLPRSHPNAVLHDPHAITARVRQMLETGRVATIDGPLITLLPETFCVHSDTAESVEILKAVSQL